MHVIGLDEYITGTYSRNELIIKSLQVDLNMHAPRPLVYPYILKMH